MARARGEAKRGGSGSDGGGYFGGRYRDGGLSGVIGFLGQTGTGKTYRAIQRLSRARRVVFFDTVHNIGSAGFQNPMSGYVHLWGLGQFVEYIRPRLHSNFRVVFHPGRGSVEVAGRSESRAVYEFDALCRYVFELGRVVFAVDEVWRFTRPGWMPPALADLVFTGRARGVTLLYTAQRPQRVARDLTSQTSQFEVFRIQERLDVQALRGRLAPEALGLLPSLPDRVRVFREEDNSWRVLRP